MDPSSVALVGGMCCVSSTALGAAVSSLFLQSTRARDHAPVRSPNERVRNPRSGNEIDFAGDDFDDNAEGVSESRGRMGVGRRQVHRGFRATAESEENIDINAAGWEGFSMEDARKKCLAGAARAEEVTPAEVLQQLQRGNARFFTGCASNKELNAFQRRSLIIKQYPKVAVLGCSDSRVPVELVFDMGLGDMFVVRVAGNCLDTTTAASLQYAVCHLNVKVIVVLGHEGCGAVKAAQLPMEQICAEPPALSSALTMLKKGLDTRRLAQIHDARAHDREAVVTNVQRQVEGLASDESIMTKVRSKDLIVVGAFYEISSGIVDFFHEVTDVPATVLDLERTKSQMQALGETDKDCAVAAEASMIPSGVPGTCVATREGTSKGVFTRLLTSTKATNFGGA